ncbi:hypothetical protein AcW2_007118 [Taiwanofungus camphoratus]|nr:hypothetical protein AcW2_007118 [Antrodia cinnamomea]
MPGLSALEQSQDTRDQSPGSGPSSAVDDPAASLRAAALLSRKPKRRKLGDTEVSSGLPPRSLTSQSPIQLDYGQEEPSGASSAVLSAPALVPAPSAPANSEPQDTDEGQAREEGEISESETTPTTPVAPLPKEVSPDIKPQAKDKGKQSAQSKPPSIKMEPTSVSCIPELTNGSTPAVQQSHPHVLDAAHIRPGLAMTQEQYDTAKDIVLDLLGWGVPPEYLVGCGLSRELVYYVFVELNLRLPANLDMTGISPYEPPVPGSTSPPTLMNMAHRFDSLALHTPPTSVVGHPPHSHPSLPQKPRTSQAAGDSEPNPLPSNPTHALSVSAPTFVPSHTSPSITPSSADPSLLDMEQQRRQELLARKAVLASRKLKQQASSSSLGGSPVATPFTPVVTETKDVGMTTKIVPTKTVDDFLKSIEPVSDTDNGKGKGAVAVPPSMSRTSTFDVMDVDEIPGLSAGDDPTSSSYPPRRSTSSSRSMSTSDVASPTSVLLSSSTGTALPSGSPLSPYSDTTSNEPMTNGSEIDMDATNGVISYQPKPATSAGSPPPQPRRGTKRPVAADFVDMEPVSHRQYTSNGYHSPYYQGAARRKTGSFAGVSGMRRCVINLSDSEDEMEDGEHVQGDELQSDRPAMPRTSSMSGPSSQRGTPIFVPQTSSSVVQPSKVTSSTTPVAMSPAALLEKEEEIKKMKELIAQREQNRLRKLAAVSNRSTPPTVSSDNVINDVQTHVAVKQEDDDSMASASVSESYSEPADTPDHLVNSNHHDFEDRNLSITSISTAAQPHLTSISISLPESASASTSGVVTPIDVIPNMLEHPTTGDKVLTDEARQEQVVNGTSYTGSTQPFWHSPGEVGVGPHAVTSAQAQSSSLKSQHEGQTETQPVQFAAYCSPLDCYPLLRPHSHQPLLGATPGSPREAQEHRQQIALMGIPSTSNLNSTACIDLTELKMAHARQLLTNPSTRICQYEVPGGGECRDRDCQDVHLSRLHSVEPSGTHVSSLC